MKLPRLFSKQSIISEQEFIVPNNSNLFIGGLSGRTGTTWLLQILRELLKGKYYIINEHGFFVLNQFRNAGYEYYQVTPGSMKNRKHYLQYFQDFVLKYGYDRWQIYGEGLEGLRRIVSKTAIRMALNSLDQELENAQTLHQCNQCFGNFYSRLLNYHSLTNGGTLKWISKEPSYGRHINDLYNMISNCHVVILVRDGRDTALSMAKRGWCNGEVIKCIERWNIFTQMTMRSLSTVPKDNYIIIKYEDLIRNFEATLGNIFRFFEIDFSVDIVNYINETSFKYRPLKNNLYKWKKEYTLKEKTYFASKCKDMMYEFGYEI